MNRTTINDISVEEYKKLVKNFQDLKNLKERVRVSLYGHISRHYLYHEWYEEMDMAVNSVMGDINKHFGRGQSSIVSHLVYKTVKETSLNVQYNDNLDEYEELAEVVQDNIRACIINEFVQPIKSRLTLIKYGSDVTIADDCVEKTTQSIIDYLRSPPFQKSFGSDDSVCNDIDDKEYPKPYI